MIEENHNKINLNNKDYYRIFYYSLYNNNYTNIYLTED